MSVKTTRICSSSGVLLAALSCLISGCGNDRSHGVAATASAPATSAATPNPVAGTLAAANVPVAAATQLSDRTTPPTMSDKRPIDYPGLFNVVAYAKDVYSGSLPEGDVAFDLLKRWDIKTIISVDGSMPPVEPAHARGMRYVHLPIAYGGMTEERKLEIAKALRDMPKPIYVHCHHGKHRSAGATGAAAVTLGWLTPQEGVERMKVSGTAPGYKGLYTCTAGAAAVLPTVLDALTVDFVEISEPHGLTKAMVEIDEASENLKLAQQAKWQAPKDHPDLVVAAEAGTLADHFRFILGNPDTQQRPADYIDWMKRIEKQTAKFEENLLAAKAPAPELDRQFEVISQSCKTCHVKYRD